MSYLEELFNILDGKKVIGEKKEEKKHNPKAAVRNKAGAIFQAGHPNVTDDKDHFPIDTEARGRNALARVEQYSAVPPWYNGKLSTLKSAVKSAVHKKYPSIDKEAKK